MSVQPARNYDLNAAIAEAEQRFAASNPKSKSNYDTVCGFLPGGNSRTVLFYSPFPLTLSKGEGCYVFDLDGHKYADFVGEYTAGLYGHSNPTIVAAIKDALDKGIVLGGHNEYEGRLAAAMCARWPSVQRVRFTNSGTEANLMAVSTARAVTKRSKILVFEGGYHGAVFTYSAGSQVMNAPFPTVIAPFNDTDATVALIRKNADDLACVVVEPMQAGGGSIPGKPEFLKALRDETQKCG
ncbi:MAG: aminotransferase class III-fold pyridoxal phosphate-dependent enzyme, partial [Alphaproteobacteria bacterium]